MRILESERLLIRPVEEKDIEELLSFRWDSAVMAEALHEPIGMRHQRNWFNSLSANDIAMSVLLKKEGELKLIGTVGLYNVNMRHQRAVLRIRLSGEVLGKGYGYKAMIMMVEYGFMTLNLRKITSDCFSENLATIKIKLKLGFKKEGVLRQHYYQNGAFRDADVYGLLKEDFTEAMKNIKGG